MDYRELIGRRGSGRGTVRKVEDGDSEQTEDNGSSADKKNVLRDELEAIDEGPNENQQGRCTTSRLRPMGRRFPEKIVSTRPLYPYLKASTLLKLNPSSTVRARKFNVQT